MSPGSEENLPVPHVAILQATSPERRITQKEIIAGEERPKYLLIKQHQESNAGKLTGKFIYIFVSLLFFLYFNLSKLYSHSHIHTHSLCICNLLYIL